MSVHRGATTAHVRIDVGGTVVTAAITNDAVDELGLAAGHDGQRRREGERRDGRHRLTPRSTSAGSVRTATSTHKAIAALLP